MAFQFRAFASLLILALIVSFASSARLLDESVVPGGATAAGVVPGGATTAPPEVVPGGDATVPEGDAATAPAVVPGGATTSTTAPAVVPGGGDTAPPEDDAGATAPAVVPGGATTPPDEGDAATAPAVVPGGATTPPEGDAATAPAVVPGGGKTPPEGDAATAPAVVPGGATTTAPGGTTGSAALPGGNPALPATGGDNLLTFFMHDILGGSRPSAVAVTGIVSNPAGNGQVPFAKLNGAVLNVNSGVPSDNSNGGIIDNNNIPFLTGLSGFTTNFGSSDDSGNSIIGGVAGFPVINADQFPSGMTLQKLMFGTMTVFDDEVTEGHQLGSGLVGKAQGFYIVSSEDGQSQTMAFTVTFKGGGYADSLTFFGVHRTAVAESHLAVMGGTGKYVNAKGFATVKTLPVGTNKHETDGMETILEIIVYLAY